MDNNHAVNVVRINELRKHENADALSLVDVGGYQVVAKTAEFKLGELYIYLQPDSVVPQGLKQFNFLWADKEFPDGIVPEKYRRISVRRFRGQWSEGLLMPLSDFANYVGNPIAYSLGGAMVQEGDDVAELLGITHYEEPEPVGNINTKSKQYKAWPPRSLKSFFYWLLYKLGFDLNGPTGGDFVKPPKDAPPVYNVQNLKNYPKAFEPGEPVLVTEKIYGSNARYMFDGTRMWVGSHKLWKSEKSTCIWRRALKDNPWIENLCREIPKSTVYAEVCPTQKGYTYGTNVNPTAYTVPKVFVFDILDADGKTWNNKEHVLAAVGKDNFVPVLYQGPYDDVLVKALVEGNTTVPGASHLREGIVVSAANEQYVRGLGRKLLKLKSNKFLEKETK
jgi:tRNA-binding EMAP/Myf-like protein